ncbi:MAG TPA: hypothetical protein VF017_18000 [Thermoanaerobaculia bacterium]|nr:hypothetical protein [Thermoanaerobaculia bacterium]
MSPLAPHVAAAIARGQGSAAQAKPAPVRPGSAAHVAAAVAAGRRSNSPVQAKPAPGPAAHPAPHPAAGLAAGRSPAGGVLQRMKLKAKEMTVDEYYMVEGVKRQLTWMNSQKTKFKFSGLDKEVAFNKVTGRAPVEDLGPVRVVGVPPSQGSKVGGGKKYSSLSDYTNRKKGKQQTREHVPSGLISGTLANAWGGAERVSVVIQIADEETVTLGPGEGSMDHARHFQVPFTQHNHEIDTSANDGEVAQLSHAYGLCVADFRSHQNNPPETSRQHQIALVGPWGPCDGCKERIRAFKAKWQEKATKHRCSASLVLTYFYRYEGRSIERQGETFYGYVEALTGKDLNLDQLGKKSDKAPKDTYYYRSTGKTLEFTD